MSNIWVNARLNVRIKKSLTGKKIITKLKQFICNAHVAYLLQTQLRGLSIVNPLNPFEVASQNTGQAKPRAAAELFAKVAHCSKSGPSHGLSG